MTNTPTPMDKQPYHQEAERLAKDQVFVPEKFRPMDKQTAEGILQNILGTTHPCISLYHEDIFKAMDEYSRLRSEEVAVKFADWVDKYTWKDSFIEDEIERSVIVHNGKAVTIVQLFKSPEFQQYLKDNP